MFVVVVWLIGLDVPLEVVEKSMDIRRCIALGAERQHMFRVEGAPLTGPSHCLCAIGVLHQK